MPDPRVRPGDGEQFYLEAAAARWGDPPESQGPPFLGSCSLAEKPTATGADYSVPDLNDARIQAAGELFRTWPGALESFGDFVNVFWPLDAARDPAARGSTSGHEVVDGARCCYVTIYDPFGCYEGLLHEWAHLRLLALGIGLEEHDGTYLDHELDERFVSPIRKDKLRPMSAVVHGILAWAFLTAGDLRLAADHADDVRGVVKWNTPKLEEGILVLTENARWTDAGSAFGDELIAWLDELVDGAWQFLGLSERDSALSSHREWVESTQVPKSPLHHQEAA